MNAEHELNGAVAARAHITPEPDIPPPPEHEPVLPPVPDEVPEIEPVPIQEPIPHQVPIKA